ncbi:MAG: FecCD family ABC transporter permease [Hyphomicrobiaceae bacterium]
MDSAYTSSATSLDAGLRRWQRLQRRRTVVLGVLVIIAAVSFAADLAVGPAELAISDVLSSLTGQHDGSVQDAFIVWELRLPQACLAVLIGCALGLAGLEMQTILDNPLADPFTLGVSAAAALGAALAIVLGIGIPGVPADWIVSANAFVFAAASLLALLILARAGMAGPDRLILFGIAMGFSFGALLALMQFVASPDALQQLTFWSMGSLVRANWNVVAILAAAVLLAAPFSAMACAHLTALGLGDDRAQSLGIDVARLRLMSILRISLLSALSVAAAGIIGFIGLTAPHIARLIIGSDHRFLMPTSMLTAMIVMSLAAVVSKTAMQGVVIPLGIVTALIGLPVFFALLLTRRGTP